MADPNQDPVPGSGDVQARRPYPQFGRHSPRFTNIAEARFIIRFKLKGRETFSHGLYLLSAFTYSKAINDLPEICCAAPFAQDSYNLGAERGPADFNQKLRWVLSFDYQLPFGGSQHHLDNRAMDAVFGGWHVGGIYTLATGFPFSPYLGFDPSNTGTQGIVRPDQLHDGNLPRDQRTPTTGSTSMPSRCRTDSPSAMRPATA